MTATSRAGIRACALFFVLATATMVNAQMEVSTFTPTIQEVRRTVTLKADFLPLHEVTMMARVDGTVEEISLEEGDLARAGDGPIAVLAIPDLKARFDHAMAEESVAQAKVKDARALVKVMRRQVAVCAATVDIRRATIKEEEAQRAMYEVVARRRRQLLEENAVTQEQLEEIDTELEMARAREAGAAAELVASEAEADAATAKLEAATAGVEKALAEKDRAAATSRLSQAWVEFAQIRSPYDEAVVKTRHVDKGALIRANESPIFTLMDVHQIRCHFDVPEDLAQRITQGTPVTIRIPGSEQALQVAVTRVLGHLDMRTRTRRAEVILENPDKKLLPGMFVNVVAEFKGAPDSRVVPAQAVIRGRGNPHVLVAVDGKVQVRHVSLGIDDGTTVEIVNGLLGDERVIVSGLGGLRAGDTVKVKEE